MKSLSILLGIITVLNAACNESQSPDKNSEYEQIIMTEAGLTPTVDIKNYTLITNNNIILDSINALEILKLKWSLPLAMQGKDSILFDKIPASDFTLYISGSG